MNWPMMMISRGMFGFSFWPNFCTELVLPHYLHLELRLLMKMYRKKCPPFIWVSIFFFKKTHVTLSFRLINAQAHCTQSISLFTFSKDSEKLIYNSKHDKKNEQAICMINLNIRYHKFSFQKIISFPLPLVTPHFCALFRCKSVRG